MNQPGKPNAKPKFPMDHAEHPPRKLDWAIHRQRVQTAKAMVDSSSPVVLKNTYSSPSHFNRSVSNFVRIERENARMLHRIANIMEGQPSVDSHLKPPARPVVNRSRLRQKKLLEITFDNLKMFQRIEATKPMYSRKAQLENFDKQEKQMELSAFYPLYWKQPSMTVWEDENGNVFGNAARCPRPRVFLELETDHEQLGEIVIELRADVVPYSAENFRALCTGERGLSYKCTEVHRIIPGILWQGGDVSRRAGRGGCGKSIYGDSFPDENFRLKHTQPGTVSMVNAGKDTNASQFLITAKKLDALNGVNVVVGKVILGMDVLDKVSSLVTPSGRPKHRVWISRCGQVGGDCGVGGGTAETKREATEGSDNEGGGDAPDE